MEKTDDVGALVMPYADREMNLRYWREYRQRNKVWKDQQDRLRYQRQREKRLLDLRARYHADAAYRSRQLSRSKILHSTGRYAASKRAWRLRNIDKHRDAFHRRKARKLGNGPVQKIDRSFVFTRDGGVCQLCSLPIENRQEFQLDHIVPLSRGGAHTYDNVQATHRKCNMVKSNKLLVAP